MGNFKPANGSLTDIAENSENSENSEYKTLFKKGVSLYEDDKFNESAEVFKSVIEKFPNEAEAYINYGNCMYEEGNNEEALNYWLKAREIDQYSINSYINVGNYYLSKYMLKDSIKELSHAFLIDPFKENVIINLAVNYEKEMDRRRAFILYEFFVASAKERSSYDFKNVFKKVSAHKANALEYIKVGIKHQQAKNYRKALKAYYDSISIYPNYPKAFLNIGNICFKLEKYDMAIEYWLESYKLNPKHPNLCLNLAITYEKLGKYADAFCFYTYFIKSSTRASSDLANAKKRVQKYEDMIKLNHQMIIDYRSEAEKAVENKDYETAILKYNNLYTLLGDKDLKETACKIAVKINLLFRSAEFAFNIGKQLKQQGHLEKALSQLKTAKTLWPDSYFKEEADNIIKDCRLLIGNSITAMMKMDSYET